MGFRTKKSIFYHIPKTGGIWVKEAMRRSGLYYDRTKKTYRRVHKFNLKREHTIPSDVKDFDKEGLFSFAFVRKSSATHENLSLARRSSIHFFFSSSNHRRG